MLPDDGCKTYDSSYGHSCISACCVSVVSDLLYLADDNLLTPVYTDTIIGQLWLKGLS